MMLGGTIFLIVDLDERGAGKGRVEGARGEGGREGGEESIRNSKL